MAKWRVIKLQLQLRLQIAVFVLDNCNHRMISYNVFKESGATAISFISYLLYIIASVVEY